MKSLPLALVLLAASAVPSRAGVRTAGCVIQSDRPIAAVNQDGKVQLLQKMPVDIRQPAPNRIEIRVEGQPAGAGPFSPSPYAAQIAGIMVSEADTPGYWLIGIVATETANGQRLINAWQITSKSGAASPSLDIDLSGTGSRTMKVVAPSKQGDVPVEVTCYTTMPAPAAK